MRPRTLLIGGVTALLAVPVASAAGVLDITLLSRSDAGANPAGPVNAGAPSGDGSRTLFASPDTLAAGGAVPARQLYVRDTAAGHTLLASSTRTGVPASAPVDLRPDGRVAAAISADGRFVVFSTTAGNLTPADTDGAARDVVRKDLATGVVRLVSTTAAGTSGAAPVTGLPDVSADGHRVVFSTGAATDIWDDTTGAQADLVVRDLLRGGVVPAGIGPDGAPLPGPFGPPAISADGWSVAFEHAGTVMVRDLRAGVTRIIGAGDAPDLSGDGRVVVYRFGGHVVAADTASPAPRVLDATQDPPTVSTDGTRVAFTSPVDTAPGDANGLPDVYVRDLAAATPALAARPPLTPDVFRTSDTPTIAPNGGAVALRLDDGPAPSASPAAGDTDAAPDALLATLPPTDATGPSITASAVPESQSAAADVVGTVADPSGIAAVVVAGTRARVGADGRFAVNLNLAVGPNPVSVRAIDGAGNASATTVTVTRTRASRAAAALAPRATGLLVVSQRTRTLVRFRLAARAQRVWVQLARRTPRAGRPPVYLPVGPPRRVGGTAGRRAAILSPKPLRTGIYQVRVTVISPAGTRVSTIRHVVTRPPVVPKRR